MTLMFELDLDSVKMNQLAKYLTDTSLCSKVIARTHTHTHTHTQTHTHTNCSIWTTKVVDNNFLSVYSLTVLFTAVV